MVCYSDTEGGGNMVLDYNKSHHIWEFRACLEVFFVLAFRPTKILFFFFDLRDWYARTILIGFFCPFVQNTRDKVVVFHPNKYICHLISRSHIRFIRLRQFKFLRQLKLTAMGIDIFFRNYLRKFNYIHVNNVPTKAMWS